MASLVSLSPNPLRPLTLRVAGVVVAIEGAKCMDERLNTLAGGQHWTQWKIMQAKGQIEAALGDPAKMAALGWMRIPELEAEFR